MAGMFDELWPLFLAEVTEQLDMLEQELDGRSPENIQVDALFRLFHTIKSSCAMLDFKSMEDIAHTSEDILDLVRKGERAMTGVMIEVFIEAVDTLKDQLADIAKTKKNPSPKPELVSRIRQLVEHADASTAASSAVAPAWDARELEQVNILLRDNLYKALCPFVTQDGPAARQCLVRMRNFFDLMERADWVALIRKLLECMADDHHLQHVAGRRIVAECLDALETGLPAGEGQDAIRICRDAYQQSNLAERTNNLRFIAEDILPVLTADAGDAVQYPSSADHHLSALLLDARLSNQPLISALVLVIRQLLKYRVYEQGQPVFNADACKYILLDAGSINDAGALGRLVDMLKSTLPSQEHFGQSAIHAEWSTQAICQPLWDQWVSRSPCPEVDALYDKGGFLFEIYADLESDHAFAGTFITWLYANAKVFTNVHVSELHAAGVVIKPTIAFLAGVPNRDMANFFSEGLNRHSGLVEYRKIARSLLAAHQQKQEGDAAATSVRISSETLDQFVSRVGEMVTLRNALMHEIHNPAMLDALLRLERLLKADSRNSDNEVLKLVQDVTQSFYNRLLLTSEKLDKAINHIQEDVIELRVVPVGLVLSRLPKLVRKLARDLDKQVSLVLRGEEVRVDKSLVDFLMEPLTHLVRNALDHGIESEDQRRAQGKPVQARLSVSAEHVGTSLSIEIRDDGRGLQKEKILHKAHEKQIPVAADATDQDIYRLIFHPGFSTAEIVTETSGRGVGMDAVKSRIEGIGGTVAVSSVPGQGTVFTLMLPLSVAVQGILVFEMDKQAFAISEKDVIEVVEVQAIQLLVSRGQCCFVLREQEIPLYRLDHMLGFVGATELPEMIPVMLVRSGDAMVGFGVSMIRGRQDTYMQDVDDYLFRLPAFAGASILGDGSVVVVLDARSLVEMAARQRQGRELFQCNKQEIA